MHALWTLEGLEGIDKEVLLKAMEDKDAEVRKAAIRISEQYLKKDDNQIIEKLEELKDDDSYEVLTQLVLSLNYSQPLGAKDIVKNILAKNDRSEIFAGMQTTMAKN